MKKILLISSNSSSRGGGERYLVFLARGLRRLNYEVHALLSDVNYIFKSRFLGFNPNSF